MRLKLVRLVSVIFDLDFKKWKAWKLPVGDVVVKTVGDREEGGNLELFIAAEIPLPARPPLTQDNKITIPEIPVKQTQEALETAVNILSICTGSKRHISSLSPYVAFHADDEETKAWLQSTDGIDMWMQQLPMCDVQLDLTNENLLKALSDRMDGVELLAEALSQDHATGRFHEFIRLFERAFKLNRSSLVRPLSKFLDRPYYAEEVVKKWVVDLRNPATHAYKNQEYFLESDIRPHIHVIEQVAFDVLLNKAKWYDPSFERRNFHQFQTRVAPGEISRFIKKGYRGNVGSQILDGQSAYPMYLGIGVDPALFGYWCKNHGQLKTRQFRFQVVENP